MMILIILIFNIFSVDTCKINTKCYNSVSYTHLTLPTTERV